LGARGGGDTTPTSYPAAALGELRRTWLNPMLRGPIRPEFWSGVVYATCVTLLGQQRGSAGVGAWCAAAEAALRWRISPAQAVGRRQCSGLGVTGSVSMRKVSAGQNKGRAWLCCAVVRSATVGAAARHRRSVFRPLGLATGYESWPKRKRRGRRGSPRLNTEDGAVQRGRRRCPAARAVRCSWTGLQEYTSGLLDSTGRRTRLLRSRGGQRGRSGTGGDDARARGGD
jgi:hypothetical protein